MIGQPTCRNHPTAQRLVIWAAAGPRPAFLILGRSRATGWGFGRVAAGPRPGRAAHTSTINQGLLFVTNQLN